MSGKPVEFTVSGRMVQGNAFEGKTTDDEGNPLLTKKDKTPYAKFFVGLAVSKDDPN